MVRVFWLMSLLCLPGLASAVSFGVSTAMGSASISNVDGYGSASYFRLDGRIHPIPPLAIHLFITEYEDFRHSGEEHRVAIGIRGQGVGVSGRWPLHRHVVPYARLDYLRWQAKARGLGRTLARDDGNSLGLTAGAHFPIRRHFGLYAELSGFNDVSGADLRQHSIGVMFSF